MKFKLALILLLCAVSARADTFYVTNFGINTITKYDRDGNGSLFTNSFVNGPTGIAIDAGGNVYVTTSDNTVKKFASDGRDLGVFASAGLNGPRGLAFDRSGNLYVANLVGNNVVKFGSTGTSLGVFASVSRPTGLAFDTGECLHVASLANSIYRFAADGRPLAPFTSASLSQPQGLAFDSLGVLYVANNASNVVEKFSASGDDLGSASPGDPARTETYVTQHVYISARSDGLPGSGTQRDPFDGSTQAKFDAIFKSYCDAGITDISFHIGAGVFYCKGQWDFEWGMLSGWHIKGAGKSLTHIIQIVGAAGVKLPANPGPVFGPVYGTPDNQSVEDLWIDCAWFRSGPQGDNSRPFGNFTAVAVYGENCTVRNVKVTGCGWGYGECFCIFLAGGASDLNLPNNALADSCDVSDAASGSYGGYVTGIAMINLAAHSDDSTPVYANNGRIINCNFNLPDSGNAGGMPAGFESGIVTGCTFIGYYHGIFHDTFVSRNITVVGNTIKALFRDGNGILMNSGLNTTPSENISIVGNTIYSSGGVGFATAVKNSSIVGNRIRSAPDTNLDYCVFLDTPSVQNISVLGNNIDAGLPSLSRNTSGCAFQTNRTPTGAVAIPDTVTRDNPIDDENYGMVGVSNATNVSGPIGLAFATAGTLLVVNSLTATVGSSSAEGTANTITTTGYSPAFIAVQPAPRLLNLSTRLNVQTGDNVLAGGFIISGSGTKRVLIRGLGPSLGDAGLGRVLADPMIELYDGSTILAANNNWKETQRAEINATGAPPTRDTEAAVIATLNPGAYTVIERGNGNSNGVGLIEIYDLDGGVGPELANISTRGFVSPGSNAMIAGFIAGSSNGGSSQFLIRALGPSLVAAGVLNPLADPTLELHDSNGALIGANDNWKSDQQSVIQAIGIPPTDDAEAALVATLPSGAYTAVVIGQESGSGVGLVEVYNLH